MLLIRGNSFTVADFARMCTALSSPAHIHQQVYLLFLFAGFTGKVNLASVERLFKVSGVRDLLGSTSLSSLLFKIIGKEGTLSKTEIAEAIEKGMEDKEFIKAVGALFK